MNKKSWEDICIMCGLCCHEKVVSDDFLFIDLKRKCEFLEKDNKCKVYKTRLKDCKRCRKVTPLKAMTAKYLPPTCAYIKWAKDKKLRLVKDKEVVFVEDAL